MFRQILGSALFSGVALLGSAACERQACVIAPTCAELGPDTPERLRADAFDLRMRGHVAEARALECRAQRISLSEVQENRFAAGGFAGEPFTPVRSGGSGARIIRAGGFDVFYGPNAGFSGSSGAGAFACGPARGGALVLNDQTLRESGITKIAAPSVARRTVSAAAAGIPGQSAQKMRTRLGSVEAELDSVSADIADLRTQEDALRDQAEALTLAAQSFLEQNESTELVSDSAGGSARTTVAIPESTVGGAGAGGGILVQSHADAMSAQREAARLTARADAIPARITALQGRLNTLTGERNSLRAALSR